MYRIRALTARYAARLGGDTLTDSIWYGLMVMIALSALLGGITSGSPAAVLASLLVAAMVYVGLCATAE